MNVKNCASLEASKRLKDAGIVLKTDCYYQEFDGDTVFITARQKKCWEDEIKVGAASNQVKFIPAPTMVEVWRELPRSCKIKKYDYETAAFDPSAEYAFDNENPTDALIDLLIWCKQEGV